MTRGKTVFRIDDEPVPLFQGAVPLYRTLGARNTVGRDVAMVAANLKALGYAIGSQPPVGAGVSPPAVTVPTPSEAPAEGSEETPEAPTRSTVRKGDAVLTSGLIKAIKKWQADQGTISDGVLEIGDLVVLPGPIRIDGVQAAVGDPAAAPLLTATSTTKAVTVLFGVAEAGAIREDQPVSVLLPDGNPAGGKVTGVGTTAQQDPADSGIADSPQKIQVTIALDDPDAVKGLDAATVDVTFPAETHTGVLLVPIGALLALREGGYALQLADGTLIGVELGLFAKGTVEVSGAGLAEGTRVVAAS